MPRPPKPSELIETIYDAGLHPELWSEVVVKLNAFIGSQACGLISKDPVSKSGATHYYCGVDPHYIQLYAETYSGTTRSLGFRAMARCGTSPISWISTN